MFLVCTREAVETELEEMTYENILQQMLDRVTSDVDKRGRECDL